VVPFSAWRCICGAYLEDDAEDPEVEALEVVSDEGVGVEPVSIGHGDDAVHRVDRRTEDDRRRDDRRHRQPSPPQRTDARPERSRTRQYRQYRGNVNVRKRYPCSPAVKIKTSPHTQSTRKHGPFPRDGLP